MGDVIVSVLGPVEAARNGDAIDLGGPQQRALAALLAIRAPSVVSVETLVDVLWPEHPPPRANKVIQTYISRLRKALGEHAIERRGAGYALRLPADSVDVHRFEALVTAGHPSEALALWRGPALADVVTLPGLRVEADRLEELRLRALEQRIDNDLAAGRHAEAISELQALVDAHPFREHLRAQLMLALYRAGRQAEALAAYQDARQRLVTDLGIEPGPALRELERSILRQDTKLDAVVRSPEVRRPRRRIGLAVLSVAAVAVIVAAVVLVGRDGSTPMLLKPHSLGRIDPATNTIVADVELGGVSPGLVVVAGRSISVLGREGSFGRIDASHARVVTTRPLAAQPTSAVYGAGAMWVGDARANAILRVDVGRGIETDRIRLAKPSLRARILGPVAPTLAFGAGSLWVSRGQTSVLRIEPQTARVRAEIRPRRGATAAIAYGEGALWVGGVSALTRISPTLERATATIPLRATPVAAATGYGSIWVALPRAGVVARVDADTEAVESIPVGGAPTAIATGHDGVWVVVPSEGVVLRIDPRTGAVVARIGTGATPTAIAVTGDSVWVAVS